MPTLAAGRSPRPSHRVRQAVRRCSSSSASPVVGVLVEAFVPRALRHVVAARARRSVGLVAALVVAGRRPIGAATRQVVAAEGAVAVDGPALFLQGTILRPRAASACCCSPSARSTPAAAFARPGSPMPGTEARAALHRDRGSTQTEVFPLLHVRRRRHDAVPGGQRPADDVRRARGALAAAVPAVRAGPPAPAAQPGGRAEVLPARRVLLGFFLYGVALLYGYAGSMQLRATSPTAVRSDAGNDGLLLIGIGAGRRRPAVQGRRRAVPRLDAGRLPGRPDRRSPAFMAACTKVAAFGALLRRLLRRASAASRWDWQPMLWVVAILTMVVGSVSRSPRPTSSGCSPTPRSPTPASSSPACSPPTRDLVRRDPRHLGGAVLPAGLRLHDARRLRRRDRSSATPAARRPTCRSGPGSASASPLVAGVFAFFLLAFAGHPADQRLHRQVRGLRGGVVAAARGRWSSSACCASAVAAFFYVRVDRVMFFSDPVGRRPDGGGPERPHDGDHRPRRRRHPAARRLARHRSSTWPAEPSLFVR